MAHLLWEQMVVDSSPPSVVGQPETVAVPYAYLENPQSLHLYSYVLNNAD